MLKKIVSLVLFFSLFLTMLTALVVYVAPADRVASWSNWNFFGLSLARWQGAHLGMGMLFCVASLVHIGCNWDNLLDHLRDDDGVVVVFTRPFFAGLLLTAAVFVWALSGLPPVRQLVAFSDYLKTRAVETYGEPPFALAERSTLADLARRMGMDGDKALALLRLKNIKADSADLTLAEIARQNGVAPAGVFEALKMVMEPSGGATAAGLPKDPPPGLGRRKLSDICEEYGFKQADIMDRLQAAGLQAHPAQTLSEVAKANNVLPIAVYEALRGEKPATTVVVEPAQSVTPVEPAPQQPAAIAAPQPATPATPAAQAPATSQSVPPAPQTAPAQMPQQPGQPTQPLPGYGHGALPAAPAAPAAPYVPQPGQHPGIQQQPQALAPQTAALPATPPPGLEKMMLQTFCREYDIPLSVAVQRLGRHHITAFGDMTFGELSLENNRPPAALMRIVGGQ